MLAAACLGGCAHLPPQASPPSTAAVELTHTPFFPQKRYQCGPAALATVLVDSGVATTPDALVESVWIKGRRGSLQAELLAATRRNRRLPVRLEPSTDALAGALHAGYPALVLLNLGADWFPIWHYAVVMGRNRDGWVLRSGTEPRRQMTDRAFKRAWAGGRRWAIIAAHPAHPPPAATMANWVRAADDLAEVNQPVSAGLALQAATRRWPDAALTWFAHGNQQAAVGQWSDAADALFRGVALRPDWTPAINNFVTVLLQLDCHAQAEPLIPALRRAGAAYAAATVDEFESHRPAGACRWSPPGVDPVESGGWRLH